MEEQFVLRVPPSVSERIERLLKENASSSEDASLDISFSDDGRSDIGQIIVVREESDPAPEGAEFKHGLTPPMRDARRRRFRREPDLNPELVQRVEKDLLNIMSGGTVENHIHGGERAKANPAPVAKPDVIPVDATVNNGEAERSDSDDSLEPEEG